MTRKDISDVEVCKAYKEYKRLVDTIPVLSFAVFPPFPYEVLAKKFDCDEKVAYRACERAEDRGLIEYGTSLRSGWLTNKGKDLLK